MRQHTKALIWHRSIAQRYSMNQIPPAIQTRKLSYGLLLPAVWLAWPWGQLLTLLPLHFLLSLPAASPLFSTAPWKGGWNKCYQPSRRQTAPFCLWLLLYHRAFMAQRKPASVETTMAPQRTSPSSLLLTHTLRAASSTCNWRGACRGWTVWHVHNDDMAADERMSAVQLTTIEMQLNTQRCIWNKMLTKEQHAGCYWIYGHILCSRLSRHQWWVEYWKPILKHSHKNHSSKSKNYHFRNLLK